MGAPTERRGRPSSYTREIADAICERIAAGEPLRAICCDEGMPPSSTVRGWALDDVDGFSARFARARDLGADAIAEEALHIADTPIEGVRTETADGKVKELREDMLGHRRLQVETRLKLLSRWNPKKYGDAPQPNAPVGHIEVTVREIGRAD